MVNVVEFQAQLRKFGGGMKKQAVVEQRKMTLEILRGVILGNPVDTGRMRNAWIASVGAPASGEQGGADLAGLTFGQATFVVNNCSYSGFVEQHHPNKAGFVAAVVANVQAANDIGAGA